MITKKDIKRFIRGHYYCGDEGEEGFNDLWEPFENYPVLEIEEMIDNDIKNMISFLKEHNVEVEE